MMPVSDKGEIKFFLMVCLPSFIWFVISLILWDYIQLVISFFLFLDTISGLQRCNDCHKKLQVDVNYMNYNWLPNFKIYLFGKLQVNYQDGTFPNTGFETIKHAKIHKAQINETGYFVFYLLYAINFIGVSFRFLPTLFKFGFNTYKNYVKCNLMFEKEHLMAKNIANYIETVRYKYIWLNIDNIPKDGDIVYTEFCGRCDVCTYGQ